jgi:hypothetical protein
MEDIRRMAFMALLLFVIQLLKVLRVCDSRWGSNCGFVSHFTLFINAVKIIGFLFT